MSDLKDFVIENGVLVKYQGNGGDVVIPDGVTSIDKNAFAKCVSIKSVVIPDSVTTILNSAFKGCKKLKSINIPDGVTTIKSGAFCGCDSLSQITIPKGVESIAAHTFEGCKKLKSITISEGVTSIGGHAFRGCTSLESITIPKSVKAIKGFAFYGCVSLYEVKITDLVSWFSISFENCSNPLSYAHHLCLNGEEVRELVVPKSVKSIGDYAFEGCYDLTSIVFHDGVTSIGVKAFLYCPILSKVEITDLDSWRSISFKDDTANPLHYARHLYLNGEEVTELVISKRVKSIGDEAFIDCSGITNVTIPSGVTSMKDFVIEDGVLKKYKGDGGDVVIPESVKSIGDDAFSGCTSLTSITIPSSVTSIGDGAFYQCSGITNVTIPSGVTSIGGGAFMMCYSLKSITIPDSVTSIGFYAFKCSDNLTSIKFESPGRWQGIYKGKKYFPTQTRKTYHNFGSTPCSGNAILLTKDYTDFEWTKE